MLAQLYIENIAVIEKASIDFQKGFNILTGETGAGKSIIIDSINAVLGGRISKEIVRTGAKAAQVSALFTAPTEETLQKLEELGFPLEEEENLLLQREIRAEGKAVCRINGRPATVSMLREIGLTLLSILGQHESYELLSPEQHVEYIDSFGGLNVLKSRYHSVYRKLRSIKKEWDALLMDENQKARRMDLLRYQIEELEAGNIRSGEQEELAQQRSVYRNSEKIAEALISAKSLLDGDEESTGAVSAVGTAADSLEEAAQFLPSLGSIAQKLRDLEYNLQDCLEEVRDASGTLEYDPARLEQVEDRLDQLYRLSLKYGSTEEEMLTFLENCRTELHTIELSDEKAQELAEQYEECKQEAIRLAKELSSGRRKAAGEMVTRVREELTFLDMPNVEFQVEQLRCPLNQWGCDKIQFLLSTNPGEPARPMAKIASGGELSRIMLAIKTVLSGTDRIDTLIFDEIDTGISGSAARKVGLKLQEVSRNRQVLCVTHLAQIAALADAHFLISKEVHDNKTFTQVQPLDFEGRKREVARIMGGTEITPLLLQNAEEMICAR